MERSTTHKAFSGYRRILWPTDLSRLARTALPHALQLVAGSKGELVIVHVLPTVAAYLAPEIAGAPGMRSTGQIGRSASGSSTG
jgi:nucleotide-binding universal stress UspA family protein